MPTSTPSWPPASSHWREKVHDLARDIHANPELSFEEVRAAAGIAELLREGGFDR